MLNMVITNIGVLLVKACPLFSAKPVTKEENAQESETDSGNETISSEVSASAGQDLGLDGQLTVIGPLHTAQPVYGGTQFDTQDIDAFIASMTVQPPPRDDGDAVPDIPHSEQGLEALHCESGSVKARNKKDPILDALLGSRHGIDAEPVAMGDDLAQWIIPPPPQSEAEEVLDIPIVPPVAQYIPEVIENGGSESHSTADIRDVNESPAIKMPVVESSSPVVTSSPSATASFPSNLPVTHQRSLSSPAESTATEVKAKPPVPPKHYVSQEPSVSAVSVSKSFPYKELVPQSAASSAPTSPTSPLPAGAVSTCRAGAANQITATRSADSSPMHQPYNKLQNGMGTFPRSRKRSTPPPPPPRRSSMASSPAPGSPTEAPPPPPNPTQSQTDQRSSDYENVFAPLQSSSAPQLAEKAQLRSAKQSPQTSPRLNLLRHKDKNISAKAATFERDSAPPPMDSVLEFSKDIDPATLQAFKEYKRSSSTSSTDSTSKPGQTDSKFAAFKSKLKSYVSPAIYKKQQMFSKSGTLMSAGSRGSLTRDRSNSGGNSPELELEPRKSDYLRSFSASSSPMASPTKIPVNRSTSHFSPGTPPQLRSPHTSPLLTRHSSVPAFSEDGRSSPRTFRTFLGTDRDPPAAAAASEPRSVKQEDSVTVSPVKLGGGRKSGIPLPQPPQPQAELENITEDPVLNGVSTYYRIQAAKLVTDSAFLEYI